MAEHSPPNRGLERLRARRLMVLTLGGNRVTAITGFPDKSVFASFGLPRTLPE